MSKSISFLYQLARTANDIEKLASGDPKRIARRAKNKYIGRTVVGGVSVSRMIIGTNWFLGYSHTSRAKDRFITGYQTRGRIAGILEVFLQNGIDTVMGSPSGPDCVLTKAIKDAQNRIGRRMILI
ncbi:unnamed protein product, partial [marine sediment metagenome]